MEIGAKVKVKDIEYIIVDATQYGYPDIKLGSGLTADVFLGVRSTSSVSGPENLPEKLVVKVQRAEITQDVQRQFQSEGENLLIFQSKETELLTQGGENKLQIAHHSPILYEDKSREKHPYLAIELIEGESVYDRIRAGELYPEEEALEIIEQLLWVLHVLHTKMYRTFIDLQLKDLYWYPDRKLLKVIDWNVLSTRKTAMTLKAGPDLSRVATYLLRLITGTGISLNAIKLDQKGLARRSLESILLWEEISPNTQEIIGKALHVDGNQRFLTAADFQDAIIKRLQDWRQPPNVLLERARTFVDQAYDELRNEAQDLSKVVSLSKSVYDLAFLARKKSDLQHLPADLNYIEQFAEEHRLHGVSFYEAATQFFQFSAYHDADISIDAAIQAGWGLNAFRIKQVIQLGIRVKEALKDKRPELMQALDAMESLNWQKASEILQSVSAGLDHPIELMDLLQEVGIRILLMKVKSLDNQAATAADPGKLLTDASRMVDEAVTLLIKFSNEQYRMQLEDEIGDLVQTKGIYLERARQWGSFKANIQDIATDLDQNRLENAAQKMQALLTDSDQLLEAMQKKELNELFINKGIQLIKANEYLKARYLLSITAVLPWGEIENDEQLKSLYRASEEIVTAWEALHNGSPRTARLSLNTAFGFLSGIDINPILLNFQVAAKNRLSSADRLEYPQLLSWLNDELAPDSQEVHAIQVSWEQQRRHEHSIELIKIKEEIAKLRGLGTIGELETLEHFLRGQLAISGQDSTIAQSLADYLTNITQERKSLEVHMDQEKIRRDQKAKLDAIIARCQSANDLEELTQGHSELKEFYMGVKDSSLEQDIDFQNYIIKFVKRNEIWIKEWNSRGRELKRLLSVFDAAERVARYIDSKHRKQLLEEASRFYTNRSMPIGSDGMRKLQEFIKHYSGEWQVPVPYEAGSQLGGSQGKTKKGGAGKLIAVGFSTGVIGLVLGGLLIWSFISLGLGKYLFGERTLATPTLGVTASVEPTDLPVIVTDEPTDIPTVNPFYSLPPTDMELNLVISSTDPRIEASNELREWGEKNNQQLLVLPETGEPYYVFAVEFPELITINTQEGVVKQGGMAYVLLNGQTEPAYGIDLMWTEAGWDLTVYDTSLLAEGLNTFTLVFEANDGSAVSDDLFFAWAPVIFGTPSSTYVYERIDASAVSDLTGTYNAGTQLKIIGWTSSNDTNNPNWYQLENMNWVSASWVNLSLPFLDPVTIKTDSPLPPSKVDYLKSIFKSE
jgi:serine/threonine protein kinase